MEDIEKKLYSTYFEYYVEIFSYIGTYLTEGNFIKYKEYMDILEDVSRKSNIFEAMNYAERLEYIKRGIRIMEEKCQEIPYIAIAARNNIIDGLI